MKLLESFNSDYQLEAGCDEAGRGCLAGPVVAASVILKPGVVIDGLNDSKKLSEAKRIKLAEEIKSNALCYAIRFVDNNRIDEINILNASIEAMHLCIQELAVRPLHIIIDGNRFKPFEDIPYTTIVKGDSKYQSIAAASILAKTARDEYMLKLHLKYPMYSWKENKGYPTILHKRAIQSNGLTHYHRKTFQYALTPKQLNLFD